MRWAVIALLCSACSFKVPGLPIVPAQDPAPDLSSPPAPPDLAEPADLVPVCVPVCAGDDCTLACSTAASCQCKQTCRDDQCSYLVEANVTAEIRCEQDAVCNVTCNAGATCRIECRDGSKCSCDGAGCDFRK